MKKLVTISLFIFWAAVTALLTAGLVFSESPKTADPITAATPDPAATTSTVVAAPTEATQTAEVAPPQTFLSAAEVAKHNTTGDCWLIISGRVYNVTSYLAVHPGGADMIAQSCGADGTQLFKTKSGSGNDHSADVYNLLGNYLVGSIGQPLPPATASAVVAAPINKAVLPSIAPAAAAKPKAPTAPAPKPATTASNTQATASIVLSAAEVAKHNTASDCWLIISGKVYDVTSYIDIHPGGAAMITQTCGADGTQLFQTKGGAGGSHSSNAVSLLANYLVGTLGEQTTAAQIQQSQQQAQQTSQTQPTGGRGNEFDDD